MNERRHRRALLSEPGFWDPQTVVEMGSNSATSWSCRLLTPGAAPLERCRAVPTTERPDEADGVVVADAAADLGDR
jgi:hypothetical protein